MIYLFRKLPIKYYWLIFITAVYALFYPLLVMRTFSSANVSAYDYIVIGFSKSLFISIEIAIFALFLTPVMHHIFSVNYFVKQSGRVNIQRSVDILKPSLLFALVRTVPSIISAYIFSSETCNWTDRLSYFSSVTGITLYKTPSLLFMIIWVLVGRFLLYAIVGETMLLSQCICKRAFWGALLIAVIFICSSVIDSQRYVPTIADYVSCSYSGVITFTSIVVGWGICVLVYIALLLTIFKKDELL